MTDTHKVATAYEAMARLQLVHEYKEILSVIDKSSKNEIKTHISKKIQTQQISINKLEQQQQQQQTPSTSTSSSSSSMMKVHVADDSNTFVDLDDSKRVIRSQLPTTLADFVVGCLLPTATDQPNACIPWTRLKKDLEHPSVRQSSKELVNWFQTSISLAHPRQQQFVI